MNEKLLVVAAYDSQLKVAWKIAAEFTAQGWDLEVRVPRLQRGQINQRQVQEFSEFAELNHCPNDVTAILDDCMSFSAILIILEGRLTQAICHAFYRSLNASSGTRRPVLITGFVGVGLFDTYVGYQGRLLSDVLFLNAQKDLDDCLAVCETLGIEHRGLVVSGLPFVGALDDSLERPAEIRTVLFAGQPDVPERIVERLYLLEKMIEYARKFPERKVLFKPRHKPGEKTLHRTKYHFEILARTYLNAADIPPNFEFVYGPMSRYLEQTQLLVTVSSTALFEALERGVHAALICDLGISASYGNDFFMHSGLLSSFSALLRDELPAVDWDWLRRHMEVSGGSPGRIYNAVLAAIEANADSLQLPYALLPLYEQIGTRLRIEEDNRGRVITKRKLAALFLRRALVEKRIL